MNVIYNFQICDKDTGFPEKHHLWEEEDTDAGEKRAYMQVWKIYPRGRIKLYCIEKNENR